MTDIVKYAVINENDQCVSPEYDTRDEALHDAQQRIEAGQGGHAVVLYTYEFSDSELIWTSNDEDVWPPPKESPDAKFRQITGFTGAFRMQCPTDLCDHFFEAAEIVPGKTLMCPKCGGAIPVSPDYRLRYPGDTAS